VTWRACPCGQPGTQLVGKVRWTQAKKPWPGMSSGRPSPSREDGDWAVLCDACLVKVITQTNAAADASTPTAA
jgi:hypothetical protein